MDGDLGSMLESILSDPGQMEKFTQMAQSLMGQMGQNPPGTSGSPEPAEQPVAVSEAPAAPAALSLPTDTRLLSALGKAFAGGGGKSRSTALLVAMRPYMRPEKQEKLDRAMKIAQMVNVAGTVMREYGGGHGI